MTSTGFWICTIFLGGFATAALWSLLMPESQSRSTRKRKLLASLLAHARQISMGICVFTITFLAASVHDRENTLLLLALSLPAYALTALAAARLKGRPLVQEVAHEAGEFLTALGAVLLAFVLLGVSNNPAAWAIAAICLTLGIVTGLICLTPRERKNKSEDTGRPTQSERLD